MPLGSLGNDRWLCPLLGRHENSGERSGREPLPELLCRALVRHSENLQLRWNGSGTATLTRLGLCRSPTVNEQEYRAEIRALGAQLKDNCGTARVCLNGHLQLEIEDSQSRLCKKCRAAIVDECTCGYPLVPGRLTQDFRPIYREKALPGRDICPGCYDLYPWVRSWLLRPTDKELSPYEADLARQYVPLDPKRFAMFRWPRPDDFGLTDYDINSKTPRTWLGRVFGGGVCIQNPRHSKHDAWAAYRLATNVASVAIVKLLRTWAYELNAKALEKLSRWKELTGQEFERELADLLRRQNYDVTHTGGPGDEGADLILNTDKGKIVVQCKAYSGRVGPQPVRDLCGSMVHHGAQEGWLVAIDGFSESAYKFAHNKPIKLLVISSFLGNSEEPE